MLRKFLSFNIFFSALTVCQNGIFIEYVKGFRPNSRSLKNYAIFRFSCKPSVTISSVAKTVTRKVPSPETRINTGLFGTSKPKGIIPTLFRDYHLSYFTSISNHFSAVLEVFFFVLFSLSSLVLQNMLQKRKMNSSKRLTSHFDISIHSP